VCDVLFPSFDFVLDLNLRVVAWIFDSAPGFSPLLILLLSRRCGCLPFYSVATCGLVPRFPSRARAPPARIFSFLALWSSCFSPVRQVHSVLWCRFPASGSAPDSSLSNAWLAGAALASVVPARAWVIFSSLSVTRSLRSWSLLISSVPPVKVARAQLVSNSSSDVFLLVADFRGVVLSQ
jgi:hypothetical protein